MENVATGSVPPARAAAQNAIVSCCLLQGAGWDSSGRNPFLTWVHRCAASAAENEIDINVDNDNDANDSNKMGLGSSGRSPEDGTGFLWQEPKTRRNTHMRGLLYQGPERRRTNGEVEQ